jgi:hypothetical protein
VWWLTEASVVCCGVQELKREYRLQAQTEEAFIVCDGCLTVDVRDSADEWVRITLNRGDAAVLPYSLYRSVNLASHFLLVYCLLYSLR